MRTLTLAVVAGVLGLFGCSSSSDDGGSGGGSNVGAACNAPASEVEQLECAVLALVNQTRASGTTCGGDAMPPVPALEMHATLRQSARGHAEDMAQNDYFDHNSLDGRSPFDRMEAAGYDYSAAGENIAAGSSTAEATMQQWLGSSGHCKNIMNGKYVHLGVGYAYSASHQYKHLWVQNFGAP